ncbi:hypothetical protein HEK616_34130 [Streptomyces nigrescens]|uniref:Uncharacterized protein n=2 Tax=Streptomyces TaxID=1883 RepID=A0ABM7ZU98_STRNI|nr:hypothetical protein [Streptomyces nigrescens]MEE4417748.1 hypothetical protein [Streptomyces sp. DSM 41528]BDM69926.1 hypothetical protein HEK616_34130 [Streptomyces nigrescens]
MWDAIKRKRRTRHPEPEEVEEVADIVCDRCKRPMRGGGDGWNAVFDEGYAIGYLCPDCQTAEENAEAEVHEATLDCSAGHVDEDGRVRWPVKGAWNGISTGTHGAMRENKAIHMLVSLEPPELRVAVGPQSDARLSGLFRTETCKKAVHEAMSSKGAQPGTRDLAYLVDSDMDSTDVWVVEDQAMAAGGNDSHKLVVIYSPDIDPHLLDAFAPEYADSMREAIHAQ